MDLDDLGVFCDLDDARAKAAASRIVLHALNLPLAGGLIPGLSASRCQAMESPKRQSSGRSREHSPEWEK